MKKIKRRSKNKYRPKTSYLVFLGILGILLLIGSISYTFVSFINRKITIEYGQKLNYDLFKHYGFGNISVELSDEEILPPGNHETNVYLGPFKYNCVVTVQDTTAPDFVLKEIESGYGKEFSPDSFVESVNELSEYSVSYAQTPDWSLYEKPQNVSIKVTDKWGNETTKETVLLIYNYPQTVEFELGVSPEEINNKINTFFGEVDYSDISEKQMSKVGVFPVTLKGILRNYDIDISVIDTIAPRLKLIDIIAPVGYETNPRVFVEEVFDQSHVDISYKTPPDFNTKGTFKVDIIAKDESENETVLSANITLIDDNEAPVFKEAKDFDSFVGENILFREKVVVTDNCTQLPEIKIDSKSVDINKTGEYQVTYTASDLAGNTNTVTIKVNIRDKVEEEKELKSKIKEIINQIITDGMTKEQQAEAIYNYVYNHITYVSRPKQDHVKAALEAINGRGGCFNYASLAMFLFDELGIKNMFMETHVHYWNIIDIDDGHGWYHFDCTPSPETPKIFLWTDAQMMDYSSRQNRTHHYDRTKYPIIP